MAAGHRVPLCLCRRAAQRDMYRIGGNGESGPLVLSPRDLAAPAADRYFLLIDDIMQLSIPELSLVVLIGASSSGKSTFARQQFLPTEVLSSDACRALVSDD